MAIYFVVGYRIVLLVKSTGVSSFLVESAGMVVVVGGLRLSCLSTAKPSVRTGKPWQKLPRLGVAKPRERTGQLTEMVKTAWS